MIDDIDVEMVEYSYSYTPAVFDARNKMIHDGYGDETMVFEALDEDDVVLSSFVVKRRTYNSDRM